MNDIIDVKPPLLLSFNYLPLLLYFSLCLFVILLLSFFFFVKNKKINSKKNVKKSLSSPREIALAELERIVKEKYIEKRKYEVFYNRLTDIIKTFLSAKYQIDFRVRTTAEIISLLAKAETDPEFNHQVYLCLKDFDFAKYSAWEVSEKDMRDSLSLLFSLLKGQT